MYRYNSNASTIEMSGEIAGDAPARRTVSRGGAVQFVLDRIALWQDRHRQRAALLRLDNRLLRDIGLSLADVEHEVGKPFWR